MAMVVYQIRNRFTAVLLGQVKLTASILFDMVVLHVRLWSVVVGERGGNMRLSILR